MNVCFKFNMHNYHVSNIKYFQFYFTKLLNRNKYSFRPIMSDSVQYFTQIKKSV